MAKVFSFCVIFSLFCLWSIAAAEEDDVAEKPKVKMISDTFGFLGPEIYKADKAAEFLRIADFNSDGKPDILFVDNSKNEIYVLMQRETDEHPAFEKITFATERWIGSLDAGDLNQDGRVDWAYVGDPKKVAIRYGAVEGRFEEQQELETEGRYLEISDFNGDGRADLLVLDEAFFYLIYQDDEGNLKEPEKYPFRSREGAFFEVGDINGDGKGDVVFGSRRGSDEISYRLSNPQGRLDPELVQELRNLQDLYVKDVDGDGRAEIFSFHKNTKALKLLSLKEAEESDKSPQLSQVRYYAYKDRGVRGEFRVATGDINGNGKLEVVLADSSAATLKIYEQDEQGNLIQERTFPSLTGVTAVKVHDLDADGRGEILLLSPEEELIGIAAMKDGEIKFPKPILPLGKPVAFDAGDVTGSGKMDLVYATERKGDAMPALYILAQTEEGSFEQLKKIDLDKNAVAKEIVVRDLNSDGPIDILVFYQFTPISFFLQDDEGNFQDVAGAKEFQKGLVQKIAPENVSFADVDGDGQTELLVARKNFARSLSLDENHSLVVEEQFNGKSANSIILWTQVEDLDKDGQKEVLLLDAFARSLCILKKNKDNIYEVTQEMNVGRLAFSGAELADLNADGKKDILLAEDDRFGCIYTGKSDPQIKLLDTYKTLLEEGQYAAITSGDVNADGKCDLVLIEGRKHHLEILSVTEKGHFRQELAFPVFEIPVEEMEAPIFRREGTATPEPREIAVADMNGDGKEDIVVLVHDNVLIYPQE